MLPYTSTRTERWSKRVVAGGVGGDGVIPVVQREVRTAVRTARLSADGDGHIQ